MAGGGVVLPTSSCGAASAVIGFLPSAALGDAMRAALVDAPLDGTALVIPVVWGVLGTFLTARTFKWE
ncbi:hypothetical protein [Nocardioides sp. B-3]|uniref:hypothetical protein n=1 Tax=Nocardioides sp. B-3 TaxID=2895565 RepID=UPI00300E4C66